MAMHLARALTRLQEGHSVTKRLTATSLSPPTRREVAARTTPASAAGRVYGYARVSTARQADEGESLDVQQRQLDALDVLGRLKEGGINLHMIDLGGDVTGNGVSKLVFTILSAVAEAERDRTRERVAEVKRDQRQRGRYLGGKVPWGWKVGDAGDLLPETTKRAALKQMRKLRAEGASLRAISDKMKAAGVSITHQGVKNALAAANRPASD
jgi:DNA invertase Pin-like site-specific DNA recombinase